MTARMTHPRLLSCLTLAAISSAKPASGSTPESWEELRRNTYSACKTESQFREPRITAYAVFSSVTVATVEGLWPQQHMKQEKGRVFCVYDMERQNAEVTQPEPDVWSNLPR